MTAQPITPEISSRICRHMNNDHQDAIITYATEYGGITNIESAKMIEITPSQMELEVNGEFLEIPFDHLLKDSEDAHQTLVLMTKNKRISTKK